MSVYRGSVRRTSRSIFPGEYQQDAGGARPHRSNGCRFSECVRGFSPGIGTVPLHAVSSGTQGRGRVLCTVSQRCPPENGTSKGVPRGPLERNSPFGGQDLYLRRIGALFMKDWRHVPVGLAICQRRIGGPRVRAPVGQWRG